ncbi:lysylphosphatidylglycerol synthase domain-containing protein [Sediminitomix flava]|uniref:Uncharacterized membrane protein YbhN (UPF0104 family) n=1 Tax=Sediminitomix flava TaxID=379075 RepID=A0A315Z6R5_SEDFL|nr:lysylphosphatidylglycerol synthase domain-containing protein [Sediminitomix flava]PWJ40118.1 uncharacterized membrane protein YbhN (UPF0104 family) [Sediminitomix flava]
MSEGHYKTNKIPFFKIFSQISFVLSCIFMIYVFKDKLNSEELFSLPKHTNLTFLAISVLLVPINWLIESLRWYLLAQLHLNISFKEVFKGTLQSVALSFFSGRIIGDIIGKGKYLSKNSQKLKTTGPTIVNNTLMSIPTLCVGLCAAFLYFNSWTKYTYFISIILITILILVSFLVIKKKRKFKFTDFLIQYSSKTIGRNILLAFLRYTIFSIQYLFIFYFLDVQNSISTLMIGIALVFVSKSFVPALNAIGDLGVREASAHIFFSNYGVEANIIFQATFIIWIINIFTPALLGIFIYLIEEFQIHKSTTSDSLKTQK